MDKQQIIDALSGRQAATFCRVVVDRQAGTLVTAPGEVRKRTVYSFQLVKYPRRKPVRDAVDAGDRDAPKLPPWVDRSEIAPNGLKFWIGKDGSQYLALPVFGDNSQFPVTWFLNGKKVKEEKVLPMLTAYEKSQIKKVSDEKATREKKGQAVARAVLLENIKEIL